MIVGVGVDVCDVGRWRAVCERRPGFAERWLGSAEASLGVESQAARFAAREALVKAVGASGWRWSEVAVVTDAAGAPSFALTGAWGERCAGMRLHLSMSHDGGVATAFVVAEYLSDKA